MGTIGRAFAVTDDEYSRLVRQRKAKSNFAALARLVVELPEIRKAAAANSVLVWSYNLAKRCLSAEHLSQLRAGHLRGASGPTSRPAETEQSAAFLPGPGLWQLYKSPSRYSIEKAKRELGYQAQIDLKMGMELTAEWARWSRLI